MKKSEIKITWIEIFRIGILVILGIFLIFSIVKLFNKDSKKDNIDADYFLALINDKKLDYLDRYNSSIEDTNEITSNFKLQLALNSINSTKDDDVKNYLINIFGDDVTVEFADVMDNENNLIYKYEDNNFNLNSEYRNTEFVVSNFINVESFNSKENIYELTVTKLFYNIQNGNLKNGFFGSYSDAFDSKNNNYNLDKALFTLELTENKEENETLLNDYYNSHKDELKEKFTKYKYTFKKQDKNYILIKYEIVK